METPHGFTVKAPELTGRQQAWIAGMREMLDFLEQRPALIPDYIGTDVLASFGSKEIGSAARLMGTFEKGALAGSMRLVKPFGPHRFIAFANGVCELVQTGIEVREMEVAADAVEVTDTVVETLERVRVRRPVPTFETRCPDSILALTEPDATDTVGIW